MNYKLAKQLKNKGFSQELFLGDRFYYQEGQVGLWDYLKIDKISVANRQKEWLEANPKLVKIPTLSELIKVCGSRFYWLEKIVGSGWKVFVRGDIRGQFISKGKTPEEAVAKLWLKLKT